MEQVVNKEIDFRLGDNIALALTCLDSRFISHFYPGDLTSEILIMEKHGNAFARIYWYNDDNETVYLDWLSVDPKFREQGIGKDLQLIREGMGVCLGAKTSCLWVNKDTWMHEWYKRRGYEDWFDRKEQENTIWMRKVINADRQTSDPVPS